MEIPSAVLRDHDGTSCNLVQRCVVKIILGSSQHGYVGDVPQDIERLCVEIPVQDGMRIIFNSDLVGRFHVINR